MSDAGVIDQDVQSRSRIVETGECRGHGSGIGNVASDRICNAAILLAQVQYTKQAGTKKYIIVDAAMNDLIRPTLYESYHFMWPTKPPIAPPNRLKDLRVGDVIRVEGEESENPRDRALPIYQLKSLAKISQDS